MNVTLKAGAELDVLTRDELEQTLARHRRLTARQEPMLGRVVIPTVVTAAGIIESPSGLVVLQPPTGQRYDLLRVLLDAPGSSPTAPLTGGWAALVRDDPGNPREIVWPAAGAAAVAPVLYTDGDSCLRVFGGERLLLVGKSLTAGAELVLSVQYRQVPDVRALRGTDPETGRV